MFLGGTRKGANPFKPAQGPGVGGSKRLFTDSWAKRRRFANQALGETPPRDGPFAPSAKPIAVAMPPKTRVRVKRDNRDPGGPNPFR